MIEQIKMRENFVEVETFAENFPEFKIISIQRISEGLNSQVYRLQGQNEKQYVAKFYFRHQADTRDRLGTEFASLSALRKDGIRCVPQPLAINQRIACAIYEYIEGRKIPPQEVTTNDIDESVRFLERLKMLAIQSTPTVFQRASEACFSLEDIIRNIEWRLKRLEVSANKDEDLRIFLVNDFGPFLKILVEWYKKNTIVASAAEITQEERTLSPSDFGFHNAFKKQDGSIIFFDFEYFGWDDPAKTISDFLLHPAMSVNNIMKERFMSRLCNSSAFPGRKNMLERTKLVYPFFGLKWCLIFLNEFISDDFQRRNFAQKNLNNKKDIEQEQLSKAKKAFATVKNTFQHFPFLL